MCVIGFGKKIQNNFFNSAFLKTCQYVTLNERVCKSLKYAFIKFAKENLEKCITKPNKSRKDKQKWNRACIDLSLCPRKLNTLMTTSKLSTWGEKKKSFEKFSKNNNFLTCRKVEFFSVNKYGDIIEVGYNEDWSD